MKSSIILVEDQCKGKQAVSAKLLAIATNFQEYDHVDYRDAITVQ